MRWVFAALVCGPLAVSASSVLESLDFCHRQNQPIVESALRLASLMQAEDLEFNDQQTRNMASHEMAVLRWSKTLCLLQAVRRLGDSELELRYLDYSPTLRSGLAQLAIYNGMLQAELSGRSRHSCRETELSSREVCERESIAHGLEQQALLQVLQNFFDDLDRAGSRQKLTDLIEQRLRALQKDLSRTRLRVWARAQAPS